jgi:hypothetical protein
VFLAAAAVTPAAAITYRATRNQELFYESVYAKNPTSTPDDLQRHATTYSMSKIYVTATSLGTARGGEQALGTISYKYYQLDEGGAWEMLENDGIWTVDSDAALTIGVVSVKSGSVTPAQVAQELMASAPFQAVDGPQNTSVFTSSVIAAMRIDFEGNLQATFDLDSNPIVVAEVDDATESLTLRTTANITAYPGTANQANYQVSVTYDRTGVMTEYKVLEEYTRYHPVLHISLLEINSAITPTESEINAPSVSLVVAVSSLAAAVVAQRRVRRA